MKTLFQVSLVTSFVPLPYSSIHYELEKRNGFNIMCIGKHLKIKMEVKEGQ